MTTTRIVLSLGCVGLILGSLLAFSPTASAKTPLSSGQRPLSIKAAAQASWKQSNSHTRAMIKGRNGFMETKIITGFEAGGEGKALVQVKNLTPYGQKRTTIFRVSNPASLNSSLVKESSKLEPTRRRSVSMRDWDRDFTRSSSSNNSLTAARGHAPGTLGHTLAVGRAGFYPDSIGLELQAGFRRGTIGYNRYWSSKSK